MRLNHLGIMQIGYVAGGFKLVKPYGTDEGSGYGQGEGSFTGERLNGQVRWTNSARRRSDGVMLIEMRGMIETDDKALITFSMQGRTQSPQSEQGQKGGQLLSATFEAQDERYAWLNDQLAVVEGIVDPRSFHMIFGVHLAVNELLERISEPPPSSTTEQG